MPRPLAILLLFLLGTPAGAQSPEIVTRIPREPIVARLGSDRLRQANPVEAIVYSPDGKQLITADGATLRVWDAADGQFIRSIAIADHEFFALQYSTDGRRLYAGALAGGFTRLCRIDLTTGKLIDDRQLLLGRSNGRFSPDGKWLALRDESGEEFKVIDTTTGEATLSDRLKEEKVSSYAWRVDSSAVAAASVAGSVRVFDPKTGHVGQECRVEGGSIWSFAFSPDGQDVVAEVTRARQNQLIRVEAGTGAVRWKRQLAHGERPYFTADGKAIYYCGRADTTRGHAYWHWVDAGTGKALGLTMDSEYSHTVALAPGGKVLALGNRDGLIAQWDLGTRKRLVASADPPIPVSDLQFGPDGKTIRGWARGWYEWDVKTGKQTQLTPKLDVGASERIVITQDQRWLGRFEADDGDGQRFALTDLRTGQRTRILEGIRTADLVRFLPDGLLLTQGLAGTSTIDPTTGATRAKIAGVGNPPLLVSGDGKVAALVQRLPDAVHVRLANTTTGAKLFDWSQSLAERGTGERLHYWNGDLSIDGQRIAILFQYGFDRGALAKRFGVFAANGRKLSEWIVAQAGTPVFSPDGRTIACRSHRDVGIEVYEVATGLRRIEIGGLRPIDACTFSPDGRTLAVSVRPGPVEIWKVNTEMDDAVEADRMWTMLAENAGEPAFAVICRLRANPAEALPFLKARMKVPAGPKPEWLAARLKALDAPLYRDREKATVDLTQAGDAVEGQLWDALPSASPEVRERLTALLTKLQTMTPDKLRAIRSCEVLEAIGTQDARVLLVEWSKGAPGATLTREAMESLRRLKNR